MSTTLTILDPQKLSEKIAEAKTANNSLREKLETLAKLKKLASDPNSDFAISGDCERIGFLRSSLDLARLLHGSGSPPEEIRQVLSEAVAAGAPVIPLLKFWQEREYAVPAKDAKKYDGKKLDMFSWKIFRPPQLASTSRYKLVRVTMLEQPADRRMPELLMAALMAWDFKQAKKIAEHYELRPPTKGVSPLHLSAFGLLSEAILGNHKNALVHLENFPKGYDQDFPPKQRELAEGVIQGDAKLVRQGLKSVAKRFNTAWTLETYGTPHKLRHYGTLEKMLPDIRNHLIGHDWLLSDWAVAWMSLAWHQGMKEAFSEPELFNEWVPWSLCCSLPKPSTPTQIPPDKLAASRKAPAKLGKRAIQDALLKAVGADDEVEIKRLLSLGGDVETKDGNQRTLLLAAAATGRVKAAQTLIASKANLRAKDPQGRMCLSLAAENGNPELVTLLIKSGVRADDTNSPVTNLIYAAKHGRVEACQILIKHGANVNGTERQKQLSPLAAAVSANSLEIVKLLLAAGASANDESDARTPAIVWAAWGKDIKILELLIKSKADVNAPDFDGTRALHIAAQLGWDEAIRTLVAAGANLEATDNQGQTALHLAAQSGATGAIRILLKAGAKVDPWSNHHATPATYACYCQSPEPLQLLKEAGADLTLKDNEGLTVLERRRAWEERLKRAGIQN
jgi:ankyrin repeat protein